MSTEELREKIKFLEGRLNEVVSAQGQNVHRSKISKMSEEVVDTNPYR